MEDTPVTRGRGRSPFGIRLALTALVLVIAVVTVASVVGSLGGPPRGGSASATPSSTAVVSGAGPTDRPASPPRTDGTPAASDSPLRSASPTGTSPAGSSAPPPSAIASGPGAEGLPAALALDSVRTRLTRERFYFLLPDRFENGDPANDRGGVTGSRDTHGFDPTDTGWYHGGDLAGVRARLDYLQGLGVTAIWMAPVFRNRPVQGEGSDASAGYHGYWITDFTDVDPHFGTRAELKALVDAAHARGMKVFFDIITNHTADVIGYADGDYGYISKGEQPYLDAQGRPFDDRDFAGGDEFPELDADVSFPHDPEFRRPGDATLKVPAALNDPRLYHNRGDSTFAGESSLYGDFVGLDGLFTEHPVVVRTMIDIHKAWVTEVGIDGFRLDTVKHVNDEFWQAFAPALLEHADAADDAGDDANDFFLFGEVFDADPAFVSRFTTLDRLPAALDFPFQAAAEDFVAGFAPTDQLRDLFAADDLYIDADSNAYNLPTFLGNHDMGRIGRVIRDGTLTGSPEELLQRSILAHALLYLARGQPVVYYGDEQGFTGSGGDRDARQDMFRTDVESYHAPESNAQLGAPDRVPATGDEFDPSHPLYREIAALASLREEHPALADGAQVHRASGPRPGILAFSRFPRGAEREYLVVLNNEESEAAADVPTASAPGGTFRKLRGGGPDALVADAQGRVAVSLPGLGYAVYVTDQVAPDTAPAPAIEVDAAGAGVGGRMAVSAALAQDVLGQVTFVARFGDAEDWSVIGTDDNAPFRVFFDPRSQPSGTPVTFGAIVRDRSGDTASDTVQVVVP